MAPKKSFYKNKQGQTLLFETEPEAKAFLDAQVRAWVEKGGAEPQPRQVCITQYPYYSYELFKTAYAIADVLEMRGREVRKTAGFTKAERSGSVP